MGKQEVIVRANHIRSGKAIDMKLWEVHLIGDRWPEFTNWRLALPEHPPGISYAEQFLREKYGIPSGMALCSKGSICDKQREMLEEFQRFVQIRELFNTGNNG